MIIFGIIPRVQDLENRKSYGLNLVCLGNSGEGEQGIVLVGIPYSIFNGQIIQNKEL